MKTTIRNLAGGAALIAVLSLVPAGASAFTEDDGASVVVQHFKKVAAELGLSTQQRREIRAILKDRRDQLLPPLKQLISEQRALRALIQADTVDVDAIQAQSAKVAAVQANLALQRAQIVQQVRKVLTPEQIVTFKEIQAKRDERRDRAGARIMKWMSGDAR